MFLVYQRRIQTLLSFFDPRNDPEGVLKSHCIEKLSILSARVVKSDRLSY